MTFLPRLILLFTMVLTFASLAKSQDTNKPKSGAIAGRVSANGKGVAGVTVTVTWKADALQGDSLTVKTTSDDDGQFRVSNLRAGSYYVWPFTPAMVVAEATGSFPSGKTVVVEDGKTAEGVDFTLSRGGVITGRVSDSAGRPIVDERMGLVSVDANFRLASSIYPSINDIRTDDRGIYRIFGLPPGKYKVSIGDEYAAFTSTKGRRFVPRTFYPDVTDEAKAKVIDVAEGDEASNIDITVTRALIGFSASGHFVDVESGQSVPNMAFGLTIIVGGRPSGFMSGNGTSSSDGGFRIDNLPPGRYAVSILPGSNSTYYGESAPFDITDSDVADLEARIHRGATISGNVVFEGAPDKAALARLSQARLQTVIFTEGSNIGTATYTNINADGSFQIGPLQAGTASIRIDSANRNEASEFTLLGIDVNGADKSTGIKIAAGDNLTGVKLLVGHGTGTIRGTVRIEGGTLPLGTYVDAGYSRVGNPLTIAYAQVDALGRFVFERVPAGNYEVAINAYLDKRRVTARQSIVASDGAVTEVTITLNLNETPPTKP
jgi:hypothetical protein